MIIYIKLQTMFDMEFGFAHSPCYNEPDGDRPSLILL